MKRLECFKSSTGLEIREFSLSVCPSGVLWDSRGVQLQASEGASRKTARDKLLEENAGRERAAHSDAGRTSQVNPEHLTDLQHQCSATAARLTVCVCVCSAGTFSLQTVRAVRPERAATAVWMLSLLLLRLIRSCLTKASEFSRILFYFIDSLHKFSMKSNAC